METVGTEEHCYPIHSIWQNGLTNSFFFLQQILLYIKCLNINTLNTTRKLLHCTAQSCNMGHSSRSTKPPAELQRGIYIFHTSNTHQLVQLCKQSSTFIKNIWREKNGLFWTSRQMQPSLFCSEWEKTHMHTHEN